MRRVNFMPFLLGAVGILVIIFDGKTAMIGVRDGLNLCLSTLIPSLFPFFVLSSMVTGSLTGVSIPPFRWIGRVCRMSPGSESLLLVGLLGGYPVGAGNVGTIYQNRGLSLADARRMCIICNNAGPSFLFGILGSLFPHSGYPWLLWGIQIMATILTGILLPGGSMTRISVAEPTKVSVPDALNRGIRSMALVCGWVVLFRMLLNFLNRWLFWLLPDPVRILITGLAELSNGCLALSEIEHTGLKFLLAEIMLSLGGICVWMQTQAVFPELHLPDYIAGRILHCTISTMLSLPVISLLTESPFGASFALPLLIGCLAVFLALFLGIQKKEVAF